MGKISKKIKVFFGKIGPGFVTGAADDDPSGIATYTIAGAQFGYRMGWLTLFLLPAMIAIQEMCGRIGLVTGKGLAGVIKTYYSKKLMWFAISLLAVANTINIGADLGIMASSMQMLLPIPSGKWSAFGIYLVITSLAIIWLEIAVSYKKYSGYLKWLGLSLLVYVVTAFLIKQDWRLIAMNTLIPQIDFSMAYLMTMVGFLGTTISPYLFFWQASEEVEEQISDDRSRVTDFGQESKTTSKEIGVMRLDTKIGMIFSNLMTFFILLTAAGTLHAHGLFSIETPQQAAMALKPLAGDLAYLLFAIGMIGIGLQSIPVLAGSLAYAVAEGLGIEEGLSKSIWQAKGFYLVIALATMAGGAMNLLGINTMQALYYAAVVNGIMAVPLIFIIIKLSDNSQIVQGFKTQKKNRIIAWVTFGFMAISVVLMLSSSLFR